MESIENNGILSHTLFTYYHYLILHIIFQVKESGATRKRVYEQKYTLPNGVQADRVTSTINSEGVLTINAPKGKTAASSMNQTIEQKIPSMNQTIEQKMDRILSPSSWTDHTNLNSNRSLVDKDDLFGDNSGLSR